MPDRQNSYIETTQQRRENEMHLLNIAAAQQQFDALETGLFHTCYVNAGKHEATYAVTFSTDEIDFNNIVWYRTVNVLTGAVTGEGCALNNDTQHYLASALAAHFTPEYIKSDAIILSFEFAADAVYYVKDGKNLMHNHIVFGQSVYCADLDQIDGKTTTGVDFHIS
jgi:hypothetical protein